MKLKNVFIFTSDSKDGRLLELNASAHSGLGCLNKHFDTNDFVLSHVAPYLNHTLEEHSVEKIDGYGGLSTGVLDRIDELITFYPDIKSDNILFIRGFSTRGSPYIVPQDSIERYTPNGLIENNNATVCEAYRDKSFLFRLIEESDVKHAPKTKNYTANGFTAQSVQVDFSGCGYLVIKPVSSHQAKGVIVVKQEHCKQVLSAIINGNIDDAKPYIEGSHFGLNFWKDGSKGGIQVQEFVQATPYHYKNKDWDVTDRHVWSVIHQIDDQGQDQLSIKCHGGFRNLPQKPICKNGSLTQESSISFSGSHNPLRWIGNKFGVLRSGGGDRVFIEDEASDHNNVNKLSSDIYSIFMTAVNTSVDEFSLTHDVPKAVKGRVPSSYNWKPSLQG